MFAAAAVHQLDYSTDRREITTGNAFHLTRGLDSNMKCPRQHNFFRLHKAATERMQGKLLLCFGIWAVPAEQTHPKGWHCWGAAQHQGCHCKYPGHQICTCWGLCLSFGGDLSGSNIDQKDSKLNLRVIVQKVPAAGVTWDYRNCSSAEASGLSQAWSPSNKSAFLSSDPQLGICSCFWSNMLLFRPSLFAVCTDYCSSAHIFFWPMFIF